MKSPMGEREERPATMVPMDAPNHLADSGHHPPDRSAGAGSPPDRSASAGSPPDPPSHGVPWPLHDGPPDWPAARPRVLPLLARERVPFPAARPLTVILDPGLVVGFGVDLGPMFLHVTEALLEGWHVDRGELARRAIGNLRRLADDLPGDAVVTGRVGVTRLAVLQAPGGWASSLLLAPDLLGRWFGPLQRLLVAPARNLLAALPAGTDERLARWLRDEIAVRFPDALEVPVLRWSGGSSASLVPLDAEPASARRRGPRTARPARGPAWRARAQGARTTWYTPPDRSVT